MSSSTTTGGAYISGGELHISLDSENYSGYCDYLRIKLEELEKEKKTLEERIKEIHSILNPPNIILDCDDEKEMSEDDRYLSEIGLMPEPVETRKEEAVLNEKTGSLSLIVKDIPQADPKEKYLLVCDIARKYKTSEAWVIEQCGKGRIPCHRVGSEYRFTPSDVERLTSLAARKEIFTPISSSKSNSGNTRKSGRTISAVKAYEILDINWYGAKKLREAGFLTGKRYEESGEQPRFYYDEEEVLTVQSLAKEQGGISNLLKSLNTNSKKIRSKERWKGNFS